MMKSRRLSKRGKPHFIQSKKSCRKLNKMRQRSHIFISKVLLEKLLVKSSKFWPRAWATIMQVVVPRITALWWSATLNSLSINMSSSAVVRGSNHLNNFNQNLKVLMFNSHPDWHQPKTRAYSSSYKANLVPATCIRHRQGHLSSHKKLVMRLLAKSLKMLHSRL